MPQIQVNQASVPYPRKWRSAEFVILILVVALVVVLHDVALEDRLALILYSIGAAGGVYALVKRRAFALSAVVVAVAGTVLMADIYFQSSTESWHPLVDPVRDIVALAVLLLLIAKIVFEAYRIQREDREHAIKRQLEEKLIAMRAAALHSTSHEVRTPLATIITINETLLEGTAGTLTEDQQDFLKDIDGAARHLMTLVNDILDYAKAEVGMIKLATEPVALVPLIDQCVQMVEPRAEQASVTIAAQVASDVSEVVADPLRLKQILLNLLSNAVKYNGQGGRVNVRVRSEGKDVVIAVRDTGRGISAEHIDHLFNPYYQAVHKDQDIGTGLGLAIVKHLAELHGGKITVDSVPETGSVFTVRLPIEGGATPDAGDAPLAVKANDPTALPDVSELGEWSRAPQSERVVITP